MSFKTIETQEELDRIIGERLKREREITKEKYADYESLKKKAEKYDATVSEYEERIKGLDEKIDKHDREVAELNAKATKAETELLKHKIANESKIPYELAARLTGQTEEELREDAKTLASFVVPPQTPPPLHSNEPGSTASSIDAAYQGLLSGLTEQS